MAFPNISNQVDFPSLEKEIIAFWKENDTFLKSLEQRKGGEEFVFYDGLALDVVGDVLSSKRNRCIMTHYVAMVYRHRCASSSEIYQSDSILHLSIAEHHLGSGVRGEIFPHGRDSHLGHHCVYPVEVAFLSDEYLEMSLEDVACHSYDVVLDDLEILAV